MKHYDLLECIGCEMNKPEAKVTQVDALIHEKLMQVVLIHSMLEF